MEVPCVLLYWGGLFKQSKRWCNGLKRRLRARTIIWRGERCASHDFGHFIERDKGFCCWYRKAHHATFLTWPHDVCWGTPAALFLARDWWARQWRYLSNGVPQAIILCAQSLWRFWRCYSQCGEHRWWQWHDWLHLKGYCRSALWHPFCLASKSMNYIPQDFMPTLLEFEEKVWREISASFLSFSSFCVFCSNNDFWLLAP